MTGPTAATGRTAQMLRRLRSARKLLAAAVALAVAAATLVSLPPARPAEAQTPTTVTLVSNTGQANTGQGRLTNGFVRATAFTTGSNANGYTLTSIGLSFESPANSLTAQLWSATDAGVPNEKVADLTVPSSLTANQVNSFAAPSNTALSASTTYFVVFTGTSSDRSDLYLTTSSAEDSGGAAGWMVGNGQYLLFGGDWTPIGGALKIQVKGYANQQSATQSTDATLSALTGTTSTDGSSFAGTLTLDPAFAAATEDYIATVPNSVTHIKVTPTANESNATIEAGKGSSLASVTSATASSAIALDVGANEINVKVTAQDGTTTKTYTVVVTRATTDGLVSNVGQAKISGGYTPNSERATAFTVGSNAAGYTLTGVDFHVATATSSLTSTHLGTLAASVWTSDGTTLTNSLDNLGTKLADLTAPSAVTDGVLKFAAPQGTTLAASTTYYVLVGSSAYTGGTNLSLSGTASDNEDAGGAAGFSIANAGALFLGSVWAGLGTSEVLAFRVKGSAKTAQTQSTDATLSALTGSTSTDGSAFAGTLTLDPAFDSTKTAYTASVANGVTHLKVTPTANESNATIEAGKGASLSSVTSGSASAAIALAVGSNTVNVKVTAQDGTTIKTYAITVTRGSASASAGVTVSSSAFSLRTGSTAAYTVVLDTQPSAAVTVTPTSATTTAATVSPASLTFTTTNWNRPQSVTVTAVAAGSSVISHAAESADSTYDGITVGSVTATVGNGPAAPTMFTAGRRDAQLALGWTAPAGTLTGYDLHLTSAPASGTGAVANNAVESGSDRSKAWVAESSPPDADRLFESVIGLDNGTTYRVRLRAKTSAGVGAWAYASGTPNIELSWGSSTQTTVEGAAGVQIRMTASPVSETVSGTLTYAAGDTNPASLSADLTTGYATTFSAAADEYVLPTLASAVDDSVNEEHETFKVTIDAGSGYVVVSPATIVVTITDNDPPAAPSGLSLTAGAAKLSASWTKPAGPVTGYRLRYKETTATDQTASTAGDPSTGWVTTTASITTTSAEITGLDNGTAYHVQVSANDGQTASGNGWGDWSASQTGTPAATPTAGVTVSAMSVSVVAGATATYTIKLNKAPTADVTVTPTSGTTGVATVTNQAKTFTTTNWSQTQTVTVTGVTAGTSTITHAATSTDTAYDGISIASVAATVTAATQTAPTTLALSTDAASNTVAEDGGNVTVTATLDRAATTAVSVTLSATGTATVTDDYSLPSAFTIAVGQTSATGTVSIVDDDIDEANETVILSTSVSGLTVTGVTLTITDDDTAGVSVSQTSRSVAEGATTTYTVVLDSKPTANVMVGATSGTPANATVSPASRTFTPQNWDTTQTFTVRGVQAGSSTIAHAVTSTDAKYPSSLSVGSVSVSVTATDATLSALTGTLCTDSTTCSGSLSLIPAFDSDVTSYTASVANSVTHLKVTPTVSQSDATVKAGLGTSLTAVTSGSASAAIALSVGSNTVNVEVTAQDGTTTETYAITVTRRTAVPAATARIAYIVPGDKELTVHLEYGTGACYGHARWRVKDTDLGMSGLQPDSWEENEEPQLVNTCNKPATVGFPPVGSSRKAVNGQVYEVQVRGIVDATDTSTAWGASVEASPVGAVADAVALSSLTGTTSTDGTAFAGTLTLNPAFGEDNEFYEVTVPGDVSHVKLTPTVKTTGATVTVGRKGASAAAVASGSASAALALRAGWDDYEVIVANGSASAKYTLRVLRLSVPTVTAVASTFNNQAGFTYTLTSAGRPSHPARIQVRLASETSWPSRGCGLEITDAALDGRTADGDAISKVSGLKPNTEFHVRAYFCDVSGDTFNFAVPIPASSQHVTFTTWDVPGVPTSVTASAASATSLTVGWTAPASNGGTSVTGYKVRWRVKDTDAAMAGDQPGNWNSDAGVDASGTSHTATGLSADTAYQVQVRAFNGINPGSAWSASAEATTPPAGPTALSADAGDGTLELSWTAPSGTLSGYDVHYTYAPASGAGMVADDAAASGSDPAAAWVAASRGTETSPPTASQTLSGLDNGRVYRWRVRAENSNGKGTWAFGTGTPVLELSWPAATGFIQEGDPFARQIQTGTQAAISGSITVAPGDTNPISLSADLTTGYSTTFSASAGATDLNTPTVTTADDSVNEEHETFKITLNAGTGYTVGTPATITVTMDDNDAPAAPSGLSLTSGLAKLAVSWSKPVGPVTGYQLRYKASTATGWTTTTPSGTGTTAEITGLTRGTAYDVQVRATDGQTGTGNGWGVWSASQTAKPVGVTVTVSGAALGVESGATAAYTVVLDSQPTAGVTVTPASGTTAAATVSGALTFTTSSWSMPQTVTVTGVASGSSEITHTAASTDTNYGGISVDSVSVVVNPGDTTLSALSFGFSADGGQTFPGSGKLTPEFDPATRTYTIEVSPSATHVRFTPTANHPDATVSVNGQVTASGTASAAIEVREARVDVDVDAPSGASETYVFVLLSGGGAAAGTLEGVVWTGSLVMRDLAGNIDRRGCANNSQVAAGDRCNDKSTLSQDTYHFAGSSGWSATDPESRGDNDWRASKQYGWVRIDSLFAEYQGANLPRKLVLSFTQAVPESLVNSVTLVFDGRSFPLRDGVLDADRDTIEWSDTGIGRDEYADDQVVDAGLYLNPVGPGVTEWQPTMSARSLGGGKAGCGGDIDCAGPLIFGGNRFSVDAPKYGGLRSYRVTELTTEVVGRHSHGEVDYRVTLSVEEHGGTVSLNGTTLVLTAQRQSVRLPIRIQNRVGNTNTWTWVVNNSDALYWTDYTTVGVRIEPVTTGLQTVRVHYDEMRNGQPVDGFARWDITKVKPHATLGQALIAVIPGEFTSITTREKSITTHARLLLRGDWPNSTITYGKGTWDTPPASFTAIGANGLTAPIALDAASKNTYVWVRVINGDQVHTHLVIIDPPPRTYKVNPELRVTEGDTAQVTVSLGSPATRGGVTFEVTAGYGDGGAAADDVGEIVSTVTVPEGQRSAQFAVPTVDDEAVEDDESFTVTLTHVGEPTWAVEPDKTATATITIANDDQPPEGPEPWNIVVTPGDGTLTVTWNVSSRDGYDDSEIWHVLRWSQQFGVWANHRDPRAVGRNDGVSVDPGVNSYTITGLTNGIPTGVFVRSMVGHRNNMSERLRDSSKWVRTKGTHTTPVAPPNEAPTLDNAISDVTITSENGTGEVTLSGVFADADGDDLTVTAVSSDENVAAVSVSADYATLSVNAVARGTATVTVTADDANGGSVHDSFTVTVKATPAVAAAIADVGELQIDATHEVSLSGVFSDPDGDPLTITATSSDSAVAAVAATIDPVTGSTTALTVTATGEGTATVTVTARDSDGNSISDDFDVTVPAPEEQPQQAAQEPEAQQEPAVTLPGAVTDLTLTANGDGSVTVSWTSPTSGNAPTRYIVHLKPEGGKTGSGKTKRPKAPKTQVKYNNLQPGTTYLVWVRAQNSTGKGERTHATITLPTPQPE